MNSLTALVNSSFISYLKQDDKGNYVVCYRNHGGETKTVTLATQNDVVTRPDRRGRGVLRRKTLLAHDRGQRRDL